jgi:hypothetical protein
MPEPVEVSSLRSERIADRYTVLDLLGRGGMADVFRVRDERTGRELALKRLRAQSQDRRLLAITLFEREYHTLAQIAHPSVIRVHDYGVDEQGAHYTMELLQGADLLALGKRPWREACELLRDVASALSVLHSRRWLHRDLSPRNVFVTREGLCKLIDFGAMMQMGVAKSLVGTPPLVPPEAVQQQSLDAQADLYSLGALAYFTLTGRHAFPARTFDDLRDLWRTVVRAPEQLEPDIPPTLAQLVLELLNLDRFARPASAAAVIERLDALLCRTSDAGEERPEAGRAYLSTPKLIGRDQELARVRERMVQSLRGRGAVVLVEGEAGSGRSRFLDACVLEARLLGASVLRSDASDGTRGDYGVIGAIGEQLIQALPKLASDVARVRRGVLAQIMPSLRAEGDDPEGAVAGERRHLQTAVRDFLRAISRSKRVMIAVDDIERIDEPSLAVLAALAHKSERRRLVLVATVARDAPASAGLELLRDAALRIELPALSGGHTETLLESVFGQGRNSALLAHRIHELADGNPQRVMALCEHLVQRGMARYAAGSWSLPERLDPGDLPASIEAAFAARIAGLAPEALELAQALALTEPRAIALSDYALLRADGDHPRAFACIAALLQEGIVAPEGERYRFTHDAWPALLRARLDQARARELHARLARALHGASAMRVAHHLMESGQEGDAARLLLEQRKQLGFPYSDEGVLLLQRAVHAADLLQLPQRDRLGLRIWLLEASASVGLLDVFTRFAGETMAALQDASGLAVFRQLDPGLAPAERVQRALQEAQRRHDALPEHERSFSPLLALTQLSNAAMAYVVMAGSALDLELLEQVPSFAPFVQLAPPFLLLEMTVEGCRDHLSGRFQRARVVYTELLARLHGPDAEAMPEDNRTRARLGVRYALGIFEAINGTPAALDHAAALEQQPGYRVNAWRLRMVHHATLGDLDEARRCERRAQLLLLQDGARPYPATDLHAEAAARYLSDDLDGLKQMLDHLQNAVERFPARAASRELAHCQYLRVKGDPGSALERLVPLLATHRPETSVRFSWFGATHLMLLNALGRHAEAAAIGRDYMERSRARGLELADCAAIVRPLAEALARNGDGREAAELSEALIAHYEGIGAGGLLLGSCYETRARVAIAGRDARGFEHWLTRCRTEYERARNPALGRKLGRLQREAQLAHMAAPLTSIDPPPRDEADPPEPEAVQGTAVSRMAECVDGEERARCTLTLLLEETGATQGHLYGWLSGRLNHLAAMPETPPPAALESALQSYVEGELRAADTTAAGGAAGPRDGPFVQSGLAGLRPILLCALRDGESVVVAVAVLSPGAGAGRKPSSKLLATLAQSLLEHDDVDALA